MVIEINNFIYELVGNQLLIESLCERNISIENVLNNLSEIDLGDKSCKGTACNNRTIKLEKRGLNLNSVCNIIKSGKDDVNISEIENNIVNEYCKKYFVQEWNDISKKIIENFKDTDNLLKILGKLFSKLFYSKEDINITKSILYALKFHTPKDSSFGYLIEGISAHIYQSAKEFVERGFIVVAVLFGSNEFKIQNYKQFNNFVEFVPENLIKIQDEYKDKWRDDDFKINKAECLKVENNNVSFERQDKIRHLQEAIKLIKEEKSELLEEVYQNLFRLIHESSNRLLANKCKEYFWVILFYDDFDEYKIKSLCLLTKRCYDLLIDEIIDSLFRNDIGLKFKIILINILSYLTEDCDMKKIGEIDEKLSFRIKVHEDFLHPIFRSNLGFLLRNIGYKLQ